MKPSQKQTQRQPHFSKDSAKKSNFSAKNDRRSVSRTARAETANTKKSAVNSDSIFAYIIYFVCHFVIAAILILHSFQKWKLSANSLFILLFIAVCLPLWLVFV